MKLIEPNNFHVIEKPLDAIDVIRQRSRSGHFDDEPFYVCNISDIIKKHQIWKLRMPRVLPFYGMSIIFAHSNKFDFEIDSLLSKVISMDKLQSNNNIQFQLEYFLSTPSGYGSTFALKSDDWRMNHAVSWYRHIVIAIECW